MLMLILIPIPILNNIIPISNDPGFGAASLVPGPDIQQLRAQLLIYK